VLLVVQITICAVLVTSSLVAVRGLVRSMHSQFGFDPQNVLVADTNLTMAGYSGDSVPAMQRRMIDALETIPGVKSVDSLTNSPWWGGSRQDVFTDQTADLKPANSAAYSVVFKISPNTSSGGHILVAGRAFSRHDDKTSPRVAVINQMFARKIFGSVTKALGGYYKIDMARGYKWLGS